MKMKDEKKIILKQWTQVFIIIGLLVVLALSVWAIVKSVKKEEIKGKDLYTYNYNSNVSYKVYLKQNQFFTAPFLDMNKQYITSLIDHIDVDFKYNFQADKNVQYDYTYSVIATAKGVYAESDGKSAEIWSKAYTIAPNETKSGAGENFSVNKTVTIDYDKYNMIMTDFKNNFGLSVDSRVDVAFKIKITGGLEGEDKTLEETGVMNLQIPLLKPTIQLKPDYVNSGRQTITSKPNDSKQGINIPLMLIGVVFLLFSVYMLKIYIGKLLVTTKKSEYVLRLNKILKEYGDIIAEAENLPDLTKYDLVTIKQFNDLVDIEEELHSPIISCEIREDLETWFMILYDQTAYRYILKYEDFGKIIKD